MPSPSPWEGPRRMMNSRTSIGCLVQTWSGSQQTSQTITRKSPMLRGIETRELITLDCSGVPIQGTFHRPTKRFFSPPATRDARVPGILFLNSLSLPRAATGDSAVYWADSCAEQGYPSLRFDLPGLGDSPGNISTDLLEFINAGSYMSVAAGSAKELVARIGLSGVIIVGHCAGAV